MIKKPEVGDIYQDEECHIVILAIEELISYVLYLTKYGHFGSYQQETKSFIYDVRNNFKYIGKSKVDISKIFEVKDEN